MSKKAWNPKASSTIKKKPADKPAAGAAPAAASDKESAAVPPITPGGGVGSEIPPPLPPLGAPSAAPGPDPGAPGAVPPFSTGAEDQIKKTLGKSFTSLAAGLARALSVPLGRWGCELEFVELTTAEGDLWGEAAFPVFKMYFPRMVDDPRVMLAVITGLLLTGKIRIVKKNPPVVEAEIASERSFSHERTSPLS